MIERLSRNESVAYLRKHNDDIVRKSRYAKGQVMIDRLLPALENRSALLFRNTEDNSVVVLRPLKGRRLMIELMYSPAKGGINRNWPALMKIAQVLEAAYLMCEALTKGHAMLYGRLGFVGPDTNGYYSLNLNRGRHGRESTKG